MPYRGMLPQAIIVPAKEDVAEMVIPKKPDPNNNGNTPEKNTENLMETEEQPQDIMLQKANITSEHKLYPFLKNSRFFIIKSANEKNIEVSRSNEEWATTTFNQEKLDKAYQSCENVIFFFSINKSAHFQGMAKMNSRLTNKVSKEWQNEGKL